MQFPSSMWGNSSTDISGSEAHSLLLDRFGPESAMEEHMRLLVKEPAA